MNIQLRTLCLSLGALLFYAQAAYACTCIYAGSFIKYSEGETVIRGKVINYGEKLSHGETLYATMKVSIVDVITGRYAHSVVRFRGDPGHLCLTYVDSELYSVGSEHLFVLFSDDKEQDLAGCGEVSVAIVDGKVHGWEEDGDKWKPYTVGYAEFVEALRK